LDKTSIKLTLTNKITHTPPFRN